MGLTIQGTEHRLFCREVGVVRFGIPHGCNMISYVCPRCGGEMSSPDTLVGQPETCPSCGNVTVVPEDKKDEGMDIAPVHAPPPIPPPVGRPPGLHRQRIVLACIAGVGMLATFLPWAKMPIIGTIAGTAGAAGWMTFALFGASLGLSFLGRREQLLTGGKRIGAIAPSVLAALIGLATIAVWRTAKSDAAREGGFAEAFAMTVQIGFGVYLVVLAGIAFAIVSFVFKGKHVRQHLDRHSRVDPA